MDERWEASGELTDIQDIVRMQQEMIEAHLSWTDSPKTAVMCDGNDIIYFISLDEQFIRQRVDVAVYNGNRFIYLPDNLAEEVAESYFDYVDKMSGVLEYTSGRGIH